MLGTPPSRIAGRDRAAETPSLAPAYNPAKEENYEGAADGRKH
jgi:hypothetical protein